MLDLDPYGSTDLLGMFPLFLMRTADVACQLPTDFYNISFSKVFERLVSVRLGRFMEHSGVLNTTQFAYPRGLGTHDARLCMSHALHSALQSVQEARIVQIDFSAAFDWVNHKGILYKLCSVGIECSVLSILTQFLSNRSQHIRESLIRDRGRVSEWCGLWE